MKVLDFFHCHVLSDLDMPFTDYTVLLS